MPYEKKTQLPKQVQELPSHAKDIYKEAFNNAWDQYKDPSDRKDDAGREEVAHRVAWSAVKNKYEKIEGKWVEK